MQLTKSTN